MQARDYENSPEKISDYVRRWARKAGRVVESALGSMPGGRHDVSGVVLDGHVVSVDLGRNVAMEFKQDYPGAAEERCAALRLELRGRGVMATPEDEHEDDGL